MCLNGGLLTEWQSKSSMVFLDTKQFGWQWNNSNWWIISSVFEPYWASIVLRVSLLRNITFNFHRISPITTILLHSLFPPNTHKLQWVNGCFSRIIKCFPLLCSVLCFFFFLLPLFGFILYNMYSFFLVFFAVVFLLYTKGKTAQEKNRRKVRNSWRRQLRLAHQEKSIKHNFSVFLVFFI